jgi:hypothetical protein
LKYLPVTILFLEFAQNHKGAVVVKLLQVVLASAPVLIFLILAAPAQILHSLGLAAITTQAHQFNKILILGNAQLQFNVLEQETVVPLSLQQMFLQVVQDIQHNVFITILEPTQHANLQIAVKPHHHRLHRHQHLTA